jgi:GNAT superfamily N-acetyltransferase
VTAGFVIAPLAAAHDRQAFSRGAAPLDRYLQTQANQDIRRHIANCFVASPAESNVVAGYYTLSAASITMADLPEQQTRKLPHYPVLPAALIGPLAVDRLYQRQKLGAALLFDAIARAIRADGACSRLWPMRRTRRPRGFIDITAFRHFRAGWRGCFCRSRRQGEWWSAEATVNNRSA